MIAKHLGLKATKKRKNHAPFPDEITCNGDA